VPGSLIRKKSEVLIQDNNNHMKKKENELKKQLSKQGISLEKVVIYNKLKVVATVSYSGYAYYDVYAVVNNSWEKITNLSETSFRDLMKNLKSFSELLK